MAATAQHIGLRNAIFQHNTGACAANSSEYRDPTAPEAPMLVPSRNLRWLDPRGRQLPQPAVTALIYDGGMGALASCFFRLAAVSATNVVPYVSDYNLVGVRARLVFGSKASDSGVSAFLPMADSDDE